MNPSSHIQKPRAAVENEARYSEMEFNGAYQLNLQLPLGTIPTDEQLHNTSDAYTTTNPKACSRYSTEVKLEVNEAYGTTPDTIRGDSNIYETVNIDIYNCEF